jgi:hypothetical protein|tara:strand:- start:595 stop:1182 length:588 start_codon:yes stop_codon:yes gene_type:complete
MPITLNGSGTITGVSVGGLPDGIVDTDMIAANAVTAAKSSGRKILQVVNSISSTPKTISATTTYTDTDITDSITTTAANSKVLILGSLAYDTARDNNDCGARIRLVRTISSTSTMFFESNSDRNVGFYDGDSSNHSRLYGQWPVNLHDSTIGSIAAGTTITYKLQARTENTNLSEDIRINFGNKVSTLILLEIGA